MRGNSFSTISYICQELSFKGGDLINYSKILSQLFHSLGWIAADEYTLYTQAMQCLTCLLTNKANKYEEGKKQAKEKEFKFHLDSWFMFPFYSFSISVAAMFLLKLCSKLVAIVEALVYCQQTSCEIRILSVIVPTGNFKGIKQSWICFFFNFVCCVFIQHQVCVLSVSQSQQQKACLLKC